MAAINFPLNPTVGATHTVGGVTWRWDGVRWVVQGEAPLSAETGPAFTYTDGVVTRIDYDSGNYKLLSYTSGALTQLDYVRPGSATVRKTFTYNPDGTLASITESLV